jgi:hypothetical protein
MRLHRLQLRTVMVVLVVVVDIIDAGPGWAHQETALSI